MSTPIQKLFDLTGKTALITGGSRGLGLQIAESLGEAGARILLSSRKAADLEEAAAHLQAKGIDTRWVAADASDPAQIRKVCDEAMQRLGQIDILVNNAGATWGAPAEDYPLEAWDKVMNLNIRSIFLMSQAVGKASMIPRRQGRIINIASIAGLSGSIDVKFIAYGTSKGAVVNFTRTLAGQAPLKRIGDDDDLKGAALLFASAAGKHITGQILAVDGGVSAVHGGG
jgi:NAD(P)-dependent dehydrogenase (short-subunit alcohol dehydrogenase family)